MMHMVVVAKESAGACSRGERGGNLKGMSGTRESDIALGSNWLAMGGTGAERFWGRSEWAGKFNE